MSESELERASDEYSANPGVDSYPGMYETKALEKLAYKAGFLKAVEWAEEILERERALQRELPSAGQILQIVGMDLLVCELKRRCGR